MAESIDYLDDWKQKIVLKINSEIKPAFETELPSLLTYQYYSLEKVDMPKITKDGSFEVISKQIDDSES